MLSIKRAYIAESPHDALRLFSEARGKGLFLAGGTALMGGSPRRLDFVVDITHAGLGGIRNEGRLKIGATITLQEILESESLFKGEQRLLVLVCRKSATPLVRNLATVGGNIVVSGYPSDLPPALLVLDAGICILGEKERKLPAFEFFSGGTLKKGELITGVEIPKPHPGILGVSSMKLGRAAVDLSIVSVASLLVFGEDGRIARARIACSGVGGRPTRLLDAEEVLSGAKVDGELFRESAVIARKSVRTKSDVMASSQYRSEMLGVMVQRALWECTREAGFNT